MKQEEVEDEELCEEDKPWQGMIDFIQKQIDTFIKHGLDKRDPELFQQMNDNLAKFKVMQEDALKPQAIKATESHNEVEAEGGN